MAAPALQAPVPTPPRTIPTLDVLVVDDDENARTVLRSAVQMIGHRCRVASSGDEALRMHAAKPADVVICDWRMEGMDGIELCRRIRATDASRYAYLLFVSADATKRDFVAAAVAGADECLPKWFDLDDLQMRLVAAGRIVRQYGALSENNVELRRDSQTSFRAARVDALTGVGNRLRLEEDVDALQSQVSRYGRCLSVAMCDVDAFKRYNDARGHIAGDEMLRRVAQTIRESLRRVDQVYRYGGDEFVVVLPEQLGPRAAAALDRVRSAVEHATRGEITLSVGLATITLEDDSSVRCGVARADRAVYRAKMAGGNAVILEEGRHEERKGGS
jgi:two-component system, cell cycle response regulator